MKLRSQIYVYYVTATQDNPHEAIQEQIQKLEDEGALVKEVFFVSSRNEVWVRALSEDKI